MLTPLITAGQIGKYHVPTHLHGLVGLLRIDNDAWLDQAIGDPRLLRRTLDEVTRQTGLRFARDLSAWHGIPQRVEVSYI